MQLLRNGDGSEDLGTGVSGVASDAAEVGTDASEVSADTVGGNSLPGEQARPGSLAAVMALVGGVAALVAARPLADNSFLTHLATGRLILDQGVPSE
ncbi:MAG: hypothetical protein ACK4V6_18620, partial [Microthrixaceae bacterium]